MRRGRTWKKFRAPNHGRSELDAQKIPKSELHELTLGIW